MSADDGSPLIGVAELAARCRSGRPPVLADVRWNLAGPPGRPAYEAGHLPGAHFVDLERELSAPVPGPGGRHPLPDAAGLTAMMRRIGISAGTEVVAYDGGNALAAARLWWLLLDAGHPRVRVLDGGYAAWLRAGHEVQAGPDQDAAPGDAVARPGQLPRADAVEIAGGIAAGRTPGGGGPTLVDVRAAERFSGTAEPIDPVAGHIPGAVNRPASDLVAPDGGFRPAADVAARFAGLADPVLYCGSGITAAQTLLALRAAGLTGGRIYPGSWSDWVSDPARPVATGTR